MKRKAKYQAEYEKMKKLLESEEESITLKYETKQKARYAYNRMYLKAFHDNLPIKVKMVEALNVILQKTQ